MSFSIKKMLTVVVVDGVGCCNRSDVTKRSQMGEMKAKDVPVMN
jgi:hypothetical protein